MTVTVYADVYFILNMGFDLLFLYITARLTNTPFKVWRLILSAIAGGIYTLLCLVTVSILPLHIAMAFLMVLISFGKQRILANTAIFTVSSAAAGGIVYAFVYMTGGNEKNISALGSGGVIICLLCALSLTAGYLYVCRKNSASGGVHAYITACGKEYKAFLMKDNGNMLTDPISLDPVMVVSKEVFGDISDDLQRAFPKSLRLIPVRTAAGRDILYGFRPEKCLIREFGKRKKREVRIIIALVNGNRFTGTYDGLMPPI